MNKRWTWQENYIERDFTVHFREESEIKCESCWNTGNHHGSASSVLKGSFYGSHVSFKGPVFWIDKTLCVVLFCVFTKDKVRALHNCFGLKERSLHNQENRVPTLSPWFQDVSRVQGMKTTLNNISAFVVQSRNENEIPWFFQVFGTRFSRVGPLPGFQEVWQPWNFGDYFWQAQNIFQFLRLIRNVSIFLLQTCRGGSLLLLFCFWQGSILSFSVLWETKWKEKYFKIQGAKEGTYFLTKAQKKLCHLCFICFFSWSECCPPVLPMMKEHVKRNFMQIAHMQNSHLFTSALKQKQLGGQILNHKLICHGVGLSSLQGSLVLVPRKQQENQTQQCAIHWQNTSIWVSGLGRDLQISHLHHFDKLSDESRKFGDEAHTHGPARSYNPVPLGNAEFQRMSSRA